MTAIATAPLSLLAANHIGYTEIQRGKAYLKERDNLGKFGFDAPQIDRILAAETPEQAQDIIREAGRDPDEVLEEIAAWVEKLKSYGLQIMPAAAPAVDAQPKNKGNENENQN